MARRPPKGPCPQEFSGCDGRSCMFPWKCARYAPGTASKKVVKKVKKKKHKKKEIPSCLL